MSEVALMLEDRGTARSFLAELSDVYKGRSPGYCLEKTGLGVLDLRPRLDATAKRAYPLWRFRSNGAPLSPVLYKEGEYWFAELEGLHVSSEGFSPQEALSELEQHLLYFLDYYENTNEADLMGLAIDLKQRFSHIQVTD